MSATRERIIERHRLLSVGEMNRHSLFQALLLVQGVFLGSMVAVLISDMFRTSLVLRAIWCLFSLAAIGGPPSIHLWYLYEKIATDRRMAVFGIKSAAWVAVGAPCFLFVSLGGFPFFVFVASVLFTFLGVFILEFVLWWLCGLFAGPVVVVSEDRCFHCGYDLQGNVSDVCPECGTATQIRTTE